MKPLAVQQKVLILFGVWPTDESFSRLKKIATIITTVALFTINVSALFAAAVFFIETVPVNLELSLFAMFPFFGFLIATYGTLFLFIRRHEIADIFMKLKQIYDARNYKFNQNPRQFDLKCVLI